MKKVCWKEKSMAWQKAHGIISTLLPPPSHVRHARLEFLNPLLWPGGQPPPISDRTLSWFSICLKLLPTTNARKIRLQVPCLSAKHVHVSGLKTALWRYTSGGTCLAYFIVMRACCSQGKCLCEHAIRCEKCQSVRDNRRATPGWNNELSKRTSE